MVAVVEGLKDSQCCQFTLAKFPCLPSNPFFLVFSIFIKKFFLLPWIATIVLCTQGVCVVVVGPGGCCHSSFTPHNNTCGAARWCLPLSKNGFVCSGWSFSPFAKETIGVCGGKASSLLQKLVTVWANINGCSKREASVLCRSRLQLALLRRLARQFRYDC